MANDRHGMEFEDIPLEEARRMGRTVVLASGAPG
jgi:hypothetical protein